MAIRPKLGRRMDNEQKEDYAAGRQLFSDDGHAGGKAAGILCDQRGLSSDNPAHKFADEYHNVSTIDREAVLALARELCIDGIVSYASDVAAPTAAYVAEQLGLPTNPLESVMILTHKNLFRKFMKENGFPMPEGKSFTDREEARRFYEQISGTVMVKPVDSSGSKGVVKVSRMADFDAAWEEAMSYSLEKK